MRLSRLPPLALCVLAVVACTNRSAPLPHSILHLAVDPDGCHPLLGGRRATQQELFAAAQAWRGRTVEIGGGDSMPFECFRATLFTLQRAGVKTVSFIAEPPEE